MCSGCNFINNKPDEEDVAILSLGVSHDGASTQDLINEYFKAYKHEYVCARCGGMREHTMQCGLEVMTSFLLNTLRGQMVGWLGRRVFGCDLLPPLEAISGTLKIEQ